MVSGFIFWIEFGQKEIVKAKYFYKKYFVKLNLVITILSTKSLLVKKIFNRSSWDSSYKQNRN
jgi:hypothetical protein